MTQFRLPPEQREHKIKNSGYDIGFFEVSAIVIQCIY